MEQMVRALNTLCQRWFRRRRDRGDYDHTSHVINYHQRRNRAARLSRQRPKPDTS